METDNKFNSYSLTDEEYEKVISKYMPIIKQKAKKLGYMEDDCIQEIIISLHHSLTKKKIKKFFENAIIL